MYIKATVPEVNTKWINNKTQNSYYIWCLGYAINCPPLDKDSLEDRELLENENVYVIYQPTNTEDLSISRNVLYLKYTESKEGYGIASKVNTILNNAWIISWLPKAIIPNEIHAYARPAFQWRSKFTEIEI
ncbi:hypothetical protein H6G33_10245 [Calothrix sp. FACHB-1219]|uniref:hypothetical protein n=1 Tax=unclassified Calothrix TaxID=2619626 RepID=UPI001684E727|nr:MULTISPECIES: hypothetical protein [unclassified Calothrix]MBD2201727.1 hypothetical protein [Calothrix sp. FACHB-168]MBD2217413.1 hypothetical protein [Calothrix sp. FACHB-1219]